MSTKVKMWGNSLGIRIPKHISEKINLYEGSDVIVEVRRKIITISPIKEKIIKPSLRLKDLAKQITPQNRHEESLSGPSLGKETW